MVRNLVQIIQMENGDKTAGRRMLNFAESVILFFVPPAPLGKRRIKKQRKGKEVCSLQR